MVDAYCQLSERRKTCAAEADTDGAPQCQTEVAGQVVGVTAIPPGLERWPAPAKLNLFLHITGRRDDGYHELQTIFQLLDTGDELAFEVIDTTDIERITNVPGVPAEDDLVVKAAHLLQAHCGCPQGVKIHIDKRLPMGGGLGGGSSDAATTLVALNRLWGCGYSVDALAELGKSLGADVPVFVRGETSATAGGLSVAWSSRCCAIFSACPIKS